MRLFIDGDGSPVKEDVIKLGESYGLDVVIVTSIRPKNTLIMSKSST